MPKKQQNKKTQKPTLKYLGVMLERMDSRIEIVLEGHAVLDGKIDVLDQKVETIDQKFGIKLGTLNDKIDAVNGGVEDIKTEMNCKFDLVFDELHIIKNELKEKVGRDEFVLLEKRVSML